MGTFGDGPGNRPAEQSRSERPEPFFEPSDELLEEIEGDLPYDHLQIDHDEQ